MRCEICDGEGMIGGAPCLECGGSGIGSCCDTAGSRMVHVRYEGLANPAMDTAMGSLNRVKAGEGCADFARIARANVDLWKSLHRPSPAPHNGRFTEDHQVTKLSAGPDEKGQPEGWPRGSENLTGGF